jgi:hypothetical protein
MTNSGRSAAAKRQVDCGKLSRHLPRTFHCRIHREVRKRSREADESALWIELMIEGGLIKQSRVGALLAEANELAAIMFSARRTTQRKS